MQAFVLVSRRAVKSSALVLGLLVASVLLLGPTQAGVAQQYEYPLPDAEYPLPEPEYPFPQPPVRTTPPPSASPQLLTPFPIVRIVGRLTRRGARIRILSVKAPRGTTIRVRCRRRGCHRGVVRRARGIRYRVRFRAFERRFRAGTVIEVMVGRPRAIGKFTRFRIRRGRRPSRRDLCLRPGERRGSLCPDL